MCWRILVGSGEPLQIIDARSEQFGATLGRRFVRDTTGAFHGDDSVLAHGWPRCRIADRFARLADRARACPDSVVQRGGGIVAEGDLVGREGVDDHSTCQTLWRWRIAGYAAHATRGHLL